MTPTKYSINYSSATVGTGGNIVLPGGTSELSSDGSGVKHNLSSEGTTDADGAVVITPVASGIVIKTCLIKEKPNILLFQNESSQKSDSDEINSASSQSNDTKVFLNICTHSLIAVPGPRKGLDDESGNEVDGWRLPMSMGELRPCYDKTGRSAVVADCILNPNVVMEMNADSNHHHFICDLVVQCATRKFGHTWFGGLKLDRRFKLPKMNYAGFVDETTGLPIAPGCASKTPETYQNLCVAKQRVKSNGGKAAIIEELETTSQITTDPIQQTPCESTGFYHDAKKPNSVNDKKQSSIKIELFIQNDDLGSISLFDFLGIAADQEKNTSFGLRDLIKSPKLKANDTSELHNSQLLTIPIPFNIQSVSAVDGLPSAVVHENCELSSQLNCWSILAKCNGQTLTPATTVNVSAFLLEISFGPSRNLKTECVLPFPVDTQRIKSTYNKNDGMLEVSMPLLQSALCVDAGPDPGTRQWELQYALAGKGGIKSNKMHTENKIAEHDKDTSENVLDSYFMKHNDAGDASDDDKPLPEDIFHSRDVLSRHLLQQQEEERDERKSRNNQSRDDADVEHIDVSSFQPGGKYYSKPDGMIAKKYETDDESAPILRKAESIMESRIVDVTNLSGLAFSLV